MFTPIYLLPQYSTKDSQTYRTRWEDPAGQRVRDQILRMIREGAGEDFLQWDFEQGRLGFLEDMWDLRGIQIFREQIEFPQRALLFEGINFSYGSFFHSTFTNATFDQTTFDFAEIYNCEFVNCVFSFASFFGCTLTKTKFVGCEFVERDTMTNCMLSEVTFEKCFFVRRLFVNCKFDEKTAIDEPADGPTIMVHHELDKKDLAEVFKGIREGFVAGEVSKQARRFWFREKQCITRFNSKTRRDKIIGFFLELVTGYGFKPDRVFCTMVVTFLLFSAMFVSQLGLWQGLLLSAGAFFTFGANSEALWQMGGWAKVLYISEAFFGLSLMALFITVLVSYWFREG